MDIHYRKLLPDEGKIYRKIRLESLEKFPQSFCATYQESLNTEKLSIESAIEEQIPDKLIWGAFSDQELIGICVFVKHDNHRGSLYQMYVKEMFQGKGIGLGLIQSIIQEIHHIFGPIEITLEVIPGNDSAYFLYKKAGFKEIEDSKVQENSGSLIMKYCR